LISFFKGRTFSLFLFLFIGSTVAFARIALVNDKEQSLKLVVKYQKYVANPSFSPEMYYLLTPRHFDLLSQWVLLTLKEIELTYKFVPIVSGMYLSYVGELSSFCCLCHLSL
jgi:hypothetical protein